MVPVGVACVFRPGAGSGCPGRRGTSDARRSRSIASTDLPRTLTLNQTRVGVPQLGLQLGVKFVRLAATSPDNRVEVRERRAELALAQP